MIAGRRYALIGTVAAVVWYLCILIFWAFQPLSDSVPVGIDYTLNSPASVSVSVDCNSLFSDSSRDGSPLPTLKAQPVGPPPVGKPPLAFQRNPCALVHGHARLIFILDTLVYAAVMAGVAWLVFVRWRSSPATALATH